MGDLDGFRFDAAQYLTELRRADEDRSWEWPWRIGAWWGRKFRGGLWLEP